MHHGIVQARIKGFRLNLGDAQLFQRVGEALRRQANTLGELLRVRVGKRRRALDVVIHGEQRADDIGTRVRVDALALCLRPLAEVVIFGDDPQILFVLLLHLRLLLCELGFQRLDFIFKFLFFLFRLAVGLFRRFGFRRLGSGFFGIFFLYFFRHAVLPLILCFSDSQASAARRSAPCRHSRQAR